MHPFGATRIFLYDQPVDMRKSFEGLGVLVDGSYPGTLLTGSFFLFLNRNRTLIKILYWDGDGFAIWYKRLESGTFSGCFSGQTELSRQQFTLLLEGVTPKRLSRRFALPKQQLTL
jgi:transposase